MLKQPEAKGTVDIKVDVAVRDEGITEPAAASAAVTDEAIKAMLAKAPEKDKVIYKTYVATAKAVKKDEYMAEVTISTGDIDRDRERVDPKGIFVASPKRVPLVAGHSYGDLRKHIGDVPKIKRLENGQTTAVARWLVGRGNPEADWGWELVNEGLAAFSLGFLPHDYIEADITDEKMMERIRAGKEPIRTYTKSELVEVSQVIVPSNRAAIQRLGAEGILSKELTAAALERARDGEMSAAASQAFEQAIAAWKEKAGATMVEDVKRHEFEDYDSFEECMDDGNLEDDCREYAEEAAAAGKPWRGASTKPGATKHRARKREKQDECPDGQVYDDARDACVDKKAANDKPVVHTKPLGPYDDFDDCVDKNQDKDDPEAYCGAIRAAIEGDSAKVEAEQRGWDAVARSLLGKPAVARPGAQQEPGDDADEEQAIAEVLSEVRSIGERLESSLPEKIKEQVDKALKEMGIVSPIPAGSAAFIAAKDFAAELFAQVNALVDKKIAKVQGDVDVFK